MRIEVPPTKEQFSCDCGHSYDEHGHGPRISKCYGNLGMCECEVERSIPFYAGEDEPDKG